jgi:ferredoxin--NADP+ reductase
MVAEHAHVVRPVTVSFTEERSQGVYLFGFLREFDFIAGQVIGIALEEEGPRRLYSICSGENDREIQILYNVIDDGYLTPRLAGIEKGFTLWITEPRGSFTSDGEPAIWIAAGTGIAPFYSMFRSGFSDHKTLIHGSRYLEQFYFFDEFSSQLGTRYIRCCSAEDDGSVYLGRVTGYLQEAEALDPELKYYLCGSAEMVVETRDVLISRGIPFDRIISEIYF